MNENELNKCLCDNMCGENMMITVKWNDDIIWHKVKYYTITTWR